ncbi:MAG TPA: hypothetical protein VEF53_00715 [Patescibacteria group bacterium]|nr:hypothetical protein [Patescibacteria group bacterium]
MKKIFMSVAVLIIFAALYNWYSAKNVKFNMEFTAESIPYVFEKYELYLKPQIQDEDYPIVNGFKPLVYELSDGGVFIYDFKDAEKLNQSVEQAQKAFLGKVYMYPLKKILLVYLPGTDDPPELKNEIIIKIQEIIKNEYGVTYSWYSLDRQFLLISA